MSEEKNLPARAADLTMNPGAFAALKQGSAKALVNALDADPVALATLAIELRRESVAVLGSHEAFVRHTAQGSLQMVIRPVRLSMHDGTIYKIPRNVKQGGSWVKEWPTDAHTTYAGLVRQNAVAGCAVGQAPSVVVDGKAMTNPYVERVKMSNGRLGDIIRIVIGITVVGPSPTTGNPVVVNYTLDYDPSKDLLHQLAKAADQHRDDCYLIDEEEYLEDKQNGNVPRGWKFTGLYGGVGYLYNLRNTKIQRAYKEFVNIAATAVKKAQTVARRNAMRNHPAFVSTVVPDENGIAIIPVIGWAGDESAMRRYQSIQERLARGQELNLDDAEVIDVEAEEYEAEVHDDRAAADEAEAAVDPETEARNALILQIDEGLGMLDPVQIAELGYNPDDATLEELKAVLAKLNAVLDGGVK